MPAMFRMLGRFSLPLCIVAIGACRAGSAQPDTPQSAPATYRAVAFDAGQFVTVRCGTLPIILSAPHGGMRRVPGNPDRRTGLSVLDERTADLAELVEKYLKSGLRGEPYVVIARFSRRDADANRAPGEAFETPAGRRVYEAYHRALRAHVDEVRRRYGGGLLVDLHGQAREPDAVIRGTRDGKTMSRCIAAHGVAALSGPRSVFGILHDCGYRVLPPLDPAATQPAHETMFEGGFIVASYGSHQPRGIDAIQIEIGKQLRRPERLDRTARDIARAISGFHHAFKPLKAAQRRTLPAGRNAVGTVDAIIGNSGVQQGLR